MAESEQVVSSYFKRHEIQMTKSFQYTLLGVSAAILLGIGLIIDRIGGYGIRTDDVSASVTLFVPAPVLLGVPFTVRWEGDYNQNVGVTLRLISEHEPLVLGNGDLLIGSQTALLPCTLPPSPFRLELIETTSRAILGVSSLETLPPGPDCVR